MIKIQLSTGMIALSFAHPKSSTDESLASRATVCKIHKVENGVVGEVIHSNTAYCSRSDNFNRPVGRKLALARAICQHEFLMKSKHTVGRCMKCGSYDQPFLELSKSDRSLIWDTYFNSVRSHVKRPVLNTTGPSSFTS